MEVDFSCSPDELLRQGKKVYNNCNEILQLVEQGDTAQFSNLTHHVSLLHQISDVLSNSIPSNADPIFIR